MLQVWRRCSSLSIRRHFGCVVVSQPTLQWYSTENSSSRDGQDSRGGKSAGLRPNEKPRADTVTPASQRLAPRDAARIATRLLNCIPNVALDTTNAPLRAITILKQRSDITFEELLPRLESFSIATTSHTPLLVFFATRSFAAELHSRPDLIARAADRLIGPDTSACRSLESIVAIVDTLPRPVLGNQTQPPSASNATNDLGSEGVCVALSSSEHLGTSSGRSNNWSPDSSRFTHSLEPDKPGTVTCSLNPLHIDILERVFQSPNTSDKVIFDTLSVQLPLPSTIFENGQHHTLLHSRFERDSDNKAWSHKGTESVQHAHVLLPFSLGANNGRSLEVPLVKLTDAFLVQNCMGNIVREVQLLGKGDGKITPASEGLETAVGDYFVQRGTRPHALRVWALIVPQKLPKSGTRGDAIIEKLTSRRRATGPASDRWPESLGTMNSALLQALLRKGAKLRRVTSGGGGWGNKAGLLSLDPETSYQATAPTSDPTAEHDMDWLNNGLEQIAQPGDLIQFYLLPPHLLESDRPDSSSVEYQWNNGDSACEFGVIPSTIDNIEPSNSVEQGADQQTELTVLRNYFGALSETGMSLQMRTHIGRKEHNWSYLHETKVDIPFARMSVRRFGQFRSWRPPGEAGGQAPQERVVKHAASGGKEQQVSEAVTGLGFKPTIPRRKNADLLSTNKEHHQQGEATPMLIRYTNKAFSSPRDSSPKSYNRRPPRDFREGYASSREKASRLSQHPKAAKPVKFIELSGYKNPEPMTILPTDSRHAEAADEYFWRPNPVSGKLQAPGEATRAALETRRAENERHARRHEAGAWHTKNSKPFEELLEAAVSVPTPKEAVQPRPNGRAAHGPSKLSQMTAAILMDGKRQS